MMGYLKRHCHVCGRRIYMKEDAPGLWRPYKSWVAGDVDEGTWELHDCLAKARPQVETHPPAIVGHAPVESPSPRARLVMELVGKYKLSLSQADEVVDQVKAFIYSTEMAAPDDSDDGEFYSF